MVPSSTRVQEPLKLCGKCLVKKPLSDFHKARLALDGRQRWCKACLRTKNVEYWQQPRAKSLKKSSSARHRLRLKFDVLAHYGNGEVVCACPGCKVSDIEFLGIDHVNGGGTRERKETGRGGASMYRWLRLNDFPSGYRVLCHNCNQARGLYGYCPHERNARTQKPVTARERTELRLLETARVLTLKSEKLSAENLAATCCISKSSAQLTRARLIKAGRWPYLIVKGEGQSKPTRVCSVLGCLRPALAHSLCSGHWQRKRVHGDPRAEIPFRKTTL